DTPADGPAIDRERFEQVRRAIDRLPASYREVIVLRYLEQMSIEQIAEVLSARTATIQVRLHRARHKLKDQLKDLVKE
ncbi:MAG: sigma-70 family RNA polymerase sigma factor, partial [Phycisphaerae bacterium]